MRELFESSDGKIFDSRDKCKLHEKYLLTSNTSLVVKDINGNILKDNFEEAADIEFSENLSWNEIHKICSLLYELYGIFISPDITNPDYLSVEENAHSSLNSLERNWYFDIYDASWKSLKWIYLKSVDLNPYISKKNVIQLKTLYKLRDEDILNMLSRKDI